jgi:hypothetical protein
LFARTDFVGNHSLSGGLVYVPSVRNGRDADGLGVVVDEIENSVVTSTSGERGCEWWIQGLAHMVGTQRQCSGDERVGGVRNLLGQRCR